MLPTLAKLAIGPMLLLSLILLNAPGVGYVLPPLLVYYVYKVGGLTDPKVQASLVAAYAYYNLVG